MKYGLWRQIGDSWRATGRFLQKIFLSILLGVLYLFIVPFFWLIFLRRRDLLGTHLDDNSFWHESGELDYTLRQTYKLY